MPRPSASVVEGEAPTPMQTIQRSRPSDGSSTSVISSAKLAAQPRALESALRDREQAFKVVPRSMY